MTTISTSGIGARLDLTLNADTLNVAGESVNLPTVVNMTLPNADEEYIIYLPPGTQRFTIKVRNSKLLKLAYISGESGTTYLSLFPGCSLTERSLASTTNYVLYVQSPQPGAVVELVSWA